MAKKGTKQKSEPNVAKNEPENVGSKPKIRDYFSAIWQMLKTWFGKHKKLTITCLVLLLILLGWIVYLQIQDRSKLTNDEIVIQVNKSLGLNESNPAMLDVIDQQKVSQPFLEGAENGDKVLLYYKSGKSVLYRPKNQEIVRSGTFTPPDAKIFVRDATENQALIEEVKTKLSEVGGTELVSQDESLNKYGKILVVNVTDRYDSQLTEIAKKLDAEIIRLPNGESVPDADILVIVAP